MDTSRANLKTSPGTRTAPRPAGEAAFRPPSDGDTVGRVGGPDMRLRPVWLRFNDPSVEREFQDEHLIRALPAIRLFLTAACLLYAIFGLLDHYVISDIERIAWTIRYAVVCPLFVTTVLLTFRRRFGRVAQFMLSLNMIAAGVGVIMMTALARPPGNSLYYAGLIMVVIYGSTLIRLRTQYAALISVFLVGLYDFAALAVNPISAVAFINNEFFLVMSVGIGVFGSYFQELHIRRDYTSTRMLRAEKLRSDRLLIEAQAASTAKGEFLATMSHELRTPLNAILGFSDIMKRRMFGPIGSEKYAEYAKDIHHAADHLLNIITDILDLSKADVGKLVLNEEEVDLCESIDQACRLLREKAGEAGLRLSFEPPRRTRYALGRRQARQAGRSQSSQQRHQIHPGRRRGCGVAGLRRGGGLRSPRDGHGDRHRRGRSRQGSGAVRSGRKRPDAQPRRHRSRAAAGEEDHGTARRIARDRERARHRHGSHRPLSGQPIGLEEFGAALERRLSYAVLRSVMTQTRPVGSAAMSVLAGFSPAARSSMSASLR